MVVVVQSMQQTVEPITLSATQQTILVVVRLLQETAHALSFIGISNFSQTSEHYEGGPIGTVGFTFNATNRP